MICILATPLAASPQARAMENSGGQGSAEQLGVELRRQARVGAPETLRGRQKLGVCVWKVKLTQIC